MLLIGAGGRFGAVLDVSLPEGHRVNDGGNLSSAPGVPATGFPLATKDTVATGSP